MSSERATKLKISGLAALMLAGTVLLSGCGMYGGGGTNNGSTTIPSTGRGGLSGNVHGGQQPVSGATVILWAPGTATGYGAGASKLASTTSDANGNFNLNLSPSATITAYSVNASGVATFTASNAFAAGNTVTLTGFPTSTFFNNTAVTVLSSGLSNTQFQANVPAADDNKSATENGTGTATSQGASACTAGQNLYLTATGGNAGGGTNNFLALMVAIPPPCVAGTGPGATASTVVNINEVTTVAAVTALQQFMSINTGAIAPYTGTGTVPWTIGAPSTNTTGLANAFLQAGNLASSSLGTSAAFSTSTTLNSVVYTNTITPDFKKVNGLADVLAVCVNDTSGTLCNGTNGVLTLTTISNVSGSSTTTTVPQDTIQAMYNMATLPNPALYSGSPAGFTSSTTSTSTVPNYFTYSTSMTPYLNILWADISATAPFQSYYTTTPVDTLIDVGWKVTQGAASYSSTPALAIDGTGNIWYALGGGTSATGGIVTAYNQSGSMLFTPVTTTGTIVGGYSFSTYSGSTAAYAIGSAKASPLAIDTNNNGWYAGFYTASVTNTGNTTGTASGTYETPVVEITPAGTPSAYLVGYSPGDMIIDGNNNLFFENQPNNGPSASSTRYYDSELLASGGYTTYYGGTGRESSAYFNGGGVDQNNLVWPLQSTCGTIPRNSTAIATAGGTYPTSATFYNASLVTLSTTSPTTCVLQGTIDAANNLWGSSATYIEYVVAAGSGAVTTPTTTQFAVGTGTSFGGLYNPTGIALDGAGNLWVANTFSTTGGGVSEFSVAQSGTGQALTPTLTPLSPSGSATTPSYGFGTVNSLLKPGTPRIDSSGNLWLENLGNSSIYYYVGAAVPVVTPIAVQVKNTAIGKKP